MLKEGIKYPGNKKCKASVEGSVYMWMSVVWYLCFKERESETKTYIVLSACGPIMRVTAASG
jgi:hypothetical protein